MANWKDLLRADPTAWLLEPDNPSVRYWTLRNLLDRPEDDAEVQAARAAIAQSDVVQRLLAAQHADGYWGDDPRKPYGAASTTAHLVVLAELGVPVNDRIQRGCEYFLEASQQPDGGFSQVTGSSSREWYCVTGYMIKALTHFGYDRDPRVAAAWGYLYRRMVQGEGNGLSCRNSNDRGPCQWGFVKVLDAVATLPPGHRTAEQRKLAARLSESLLARAWDFGGRDKRWLSFGWPYQCQSDLLDIADVLARLEHGVDKQFGMWVDLILAQQDEQGHWARRAGMRLIDAGKKNRANKWITLKALRVLNEDERGNRQLTGRGPAHAVAFTGHALLFHNEEGI